MSAEWRLCESCRLAFHFEGNNQLIVEGQDHYILYGDSLYSNKLRKFFEILLVFDLAKFLLPLFL